MKTKLAKRIVKILTIIAALFLVLFVAFGTNTVLDNLERPQRRNQLSEFYYAYQDGRYYDIYLMAVENDAKNGKIYADTSSFEAFGKAFDALSKEAMSSDREYYHDFYQQYYQTIEWQFLKDKLDELARDYFGTMS